LWTANVDRAEVTDPSTVTVYMQRVSPAFYYTLRSMYTMPKNYITGLQDGPWAEKAFNDRPISVGPYKLVENRIGSNETFVAHDKYFLGTPYVRQIKVMVVPELTTKIAQLQAGEVDIVHGVLADQIDAVKATQGAQIVRSQASGSSELTFFDMMKPGSPFADVRVRQALNHAINRKAIVDNLYRGEATIQNSLFVKAPVTIGYSEELAKNEPFPYDPQKAKQLLSAAGYANGFETEIVTYDTTTTPGTPEMMQVVSEFFRQVGVRAPVQFMEAGQYVGKFRDKTLNGMGPISFGGSSPDFATVYENHYLKGSAFSYDDWPEGDEMFHQIQGEVDEAKREKMSQELLKKLSRERIPNIALVAPNALIALGPKVAAYPRPDGEPYLTGLYQIRMKN
jgi:peptide/nickel transport system substrate-binding protein